MDGGRWTVGRVGESGGESGGDAGGARPQAQPPQFSVPLLDHSHSATGECSPRLWTCRRDEHSNAHTGGCVCSQRRGRTLTKSKFLFVDLAGSERILKSGAEGARRKVWPACDWFHVRWVVVAV